MEISLTVVVSENNYHTRRSVMLLDAFLKAATLDVGPSLDYYGKLITKRVRRAVKRRLHPLVGHPL